MKKVSKYIIAGFGILLVLLTVFHIRYPFWVYADEAWSIGFSLSKDPVTAINLDESTIVSYASIDSITSGKTRFVADPFVIIQENVFYIFFEHQGKGNADIGLLRSEDGTEYKYQGIVLDEPFHLSFPQVFQHKGEFFMLPETKQANNVLLYKANNFPFEWEIIDTLIHNRKLEDPALLLADNFNIISASEIGSMTQYLFTSDSLRGEWKEHPNFKKRRGDETRAGGSFLEIQGEWFLPLQNNGNGYGTGLSLYKLLQKKGKIYFEEESDMHLGPAASISWFSNGMHHLDLEKIRTNYYAVYDGKKKNSEKRVLNYKASIKYNFHDVWKVLIGN